MFGLLRHRVVTEDCLTVYEVWSSRVFKGLADSCPLSDMKETDDFAVAELEFPLVEASDVEKAGTSEGKGSVPAAGEGTSPSMTTSATSTTMASNNGERANPHKRD